MPLQCVEGERRNKTDKEETTCLFINTQSDVRAGSVEQLVRSKGKKHGPSVRVLWEPSANQTDGSLIQTVKLKKAIGGYQISLC